jgi:hypothetical protein
VRDLVREPREITRVRQQQEILHDLLEDLGTVNNTVRDIVRDQSSLDLSLTERRIRDALDAMEEATERVAQSQNGK